MSNRYINALSLSGATASSNGADQENLSNRSAVVVIDITTLTGAAPTATFTLEGKDPISGKYYTILATTALNATGTTVLRVDTRLTAAANSIAADMIPPVWRVKWVAGGTVSNLTCTVGVQLVG